jgi:hypothetical protein
MAAMTSSHDRVVHAAMPIAAASARNASVISGSVDPLA